MRVEGEGEGSRRENNQDLRCVIGIVSAPQRRSGAAPLQHTGGERCFCLCKNLIATLPASPGHLHVGYLADSKRRRKTKGRMQKLPQLYLPANPCVVMDVKHPCSVEPGSADLHCAW